MMEMDLQVRRKRGRKKRAKRRWLDRVRGDINENGLSGRELGARLSISTTAYSKVLIYTAE